VGITHHRFIKNHSYTMFFFEFDALDIQHFNINRCVD
jgi:hypothetical protein